MKTSKLVLSNISIVLLRRKCIHMYVLQNRKYVIPVFSYMLHSHLPLKLALHTIKRNNLYSYAIMNYIELYVNSYIIHSYSSIIIIYNFVTIYQFIKLMLII